MQHPLFCNHLNVLVGEIFILQSFCLDHLQGFCFPFSADSNGFKHQHIELCFLIYSTSCEEHLLLLLCALLLPLWGPAVEKHSAGEPVQRVECVRFVPVMRLWGDAVQLRDHCTAAAADDDDDNVHGVSCNAGSEWRWRNRWEAILGDVQRWG